MFKSNNTTPRRRLSGFLKGTLLNSTSPLYFSSFNFDVNANTGLAKFQNPIVEIKFLLQSGMFEKINPRMSHLLYCPWSNALLEAKHVYDWSPRKLLKWRVKKLCFMLQTMLGASSPQIDSIAKSVYFVWSWLSCHARMWCGDVDPFDENSEHSAWLSAQEVPSLSNTLNVNNLPDMFGISLTVLSVFDSKSISSTSNCKSVHKCMCHIFMKVAPTRCVVRDLIVVIEKAISKFPVIATLLCKIFACGIVGGFPNATHRASWKVMQMVCKYWGNEEWALSPEFVKWIKGEYVNDDISCRQLCVREVRHRALVKDVKLMLQNLIVSMLREYLLFLFEQIPCVKRKVFDIMQVRSPDSCVMVDGHVVYTDMNDIRKANNESVKESRGLFYDKYECAIKNSLNPTHIQKSASADLLKHSKSVQLTNEEALYIVHNTVVRRVYCCECDASSLTYPCDATEVEESIEEIVTFFKTHEFNDKSKNVFDILSAFINYIDRVWVQEPSIVNQLDKVKREINVCKFIKSAILKSINTMLALFLNIKHGLFYKELLIRILSKYLYAESSYIFDTSYEHKCAQMCRMKKLNVKSSPPVVFCDACFRVRHISKNKTIKESPKIKHHAKCRFVLSDGDTLRCNVNEKNMRYPCTADMVRGFHNKASVVFLLGRCIQLPGCCVMLCKQCLLPFPVNFKYGSHEFAHLCDNCCKLKLKMLNSTQKVKKVHCCVCGTQIKRISCSSEINIHEQFCFRPPVQTKKIACNSCAWVLQAKKSIRHGPCYVVFNNE